MPILRFNITMSLDGYVAGPNQSVQHPLGEGGEKLHEWAFGSRAFRKMHEMDGGEPGPDDAIIDETFRNLGATIMGRNMFGGGHGPWGKRSVARVVGRESAVSHARVRSNASRARAARDAGRDDVLLRHRRDSIGAQARQEGSRRKRHLIGRRRRDRATIL